MPSKPHPLISEFDDHLCRLRASEAASLSPSLTATGNRLNGIQDLHDCVNKLLQLSFTQQALAQEQHKTWFDELLHESLRLLDLCGIAKDALLQTKECTHQLQSIMRRRQGRWNGAYKGDWKYLTSKKVAKNAIHKALKGTESQCTNKNQEILNMVSMLREAELVTLSMIETLFSFIAGPKLKPKSNSWWFVSKLVHPKKNGVWGCKNKHKWTWESTCGIAISYRSHYKKIWLRCASWEHTELAGKIRVEHLGSWKKMLEQLFRRLIKTRVSLFNIFNH